MATRTQLPQPVFEQSVFADDDSNMDEDSQCGSQMTDMTMRSVLSYNSERDLADFLRDYEGRTFNAQNELYFLPSDEPEFSRLDKQHIMLLLALPGLYTCPEAVQRALKPEVGRQKAILDIGTGGGNWAISMALEFPHTEVVGIDLAPSTSRPPPPNCRFEFDDVSLGIPHYHGCFDVVHARSCGNGFTDYRGLIDEIALCLRPGGVILLAEGDFHLRGEDGELLEPAYEGDEKGKSWFVRMLTEVESTYTRRGVSMDCPEIVDSGLDYHPAFEDTGTRSVLAPCGPWKTGASAEEDRALNMIGILMRQNSFEFTRAWRPMLFTQGYSYEEIDTWISKIDNELHSMSPRTSVRFRYAWGTKKANPPPFGLGLAGSTQPPANSQPHPHHHSVPHVVYQHQPANAQLLAPNTDAHSHLSGSGSSSMFSSHAA